VRYPAPQSFTYTGAWFNLGSAAAYRNLANPRRHLVLHFGLPRARIIYSSRASSSRFATCNDYTKELFSIEK
jgi:hypothetical protein